MGKRSRVIRRHWEDISGKSRKYVGAFLKKRISKLLQTLMRFRWAACQLDILKDCVDRVQLCEAIDQLPDTLDETYSRILQRIPMIHHTRSIKFLQLLLYSDRPLRLEEAIDALATHVRRVPSFEPQNRIRLNDDVMQLGSSLISIYRGRMSMNEKEDCDLISFAHFSVKEYLLAGRMPAVFKLHLQSVEAKTELVELCISYLLNPGPFTERQEVITGRPRASWAAKCWISHASVAEKISDKACQLIRDILTDPHAFRQRLSIFDPDNLYQDGIPQYKSARSPLYYTSQAGIAFCIPLFVSDQGIDPSYCVDGEDTPSLATAWGGHSDAIKELLTRGAKTDLLGKGVW